MNHLNTLPEDINKHELIPFQSMKKQRRRDMYISDRHAFALTCKSHYLSTYLKNMVAHRKVFAWLENLHPFLWAFKKIMFTDQSQRTFVLSWYQYALYTLDTGLVQFIKHCSQMHNVLAEMNKQHQEFLRDGVSFTQNNQTFSVDHFRLDPLINAYETLLSHVTINGSSAKMRAEDWQNLCSLQGQLPKHMLMEVCKKEGFSPQDHGLSVLDNIKTLAYKLQPPDQQMGYPEYYDKASIHGETHIDPVNFKNMEALVREKPHTPVTPKQEPSKPDTIAPKLLLTFLILSLPCISDEKQLKSWCALLIMTLAFLMNSNTEKKLVKEPVVDKNPLPKDFNQYPHVVKTICEGDNHVLIPTIHVSSLLHNQNMFLTLNEKRTDELKHFNKEIPANMS